MHIVFIDKVNKIVLSSNCDKKLQHLMKANHMRKEEVLENYAKKNDYILKPIN